MKLIVVGGGPAGMIAAIKAKELNPNANVLLLEKNEKLGKKLFITGKGRCNVTNNCSKEVFINSIVSNPKFMFASFDNFNNIDCMDFFTANGCPLKTERGGRVFPVSDKSSDVIKCLEKKLKQLSVEIYLNTVVNSISKQNNQFLLKTNTIDFASDKLILATGGNFYAATGSNGEGYVFASSFGHTIVAPKPSLIGFRTYQKHDLAGLTLKNVSVSLYRDNKLIATEFGELLFTHKGVSGPTILTLSTRFQQESGKYYILIDLKPALNYDVLDKRILRDFDEQLNKELKNSLNALLPSSLAKYVLKISKINVSKQVNSVTVQERKTLLTIIKQLRFDLTEVDNPDSAIIT